MWVVPLIIVALAVIGLSGCQRRTQEAEADADASTGTNPVGSAVQDCGVEGCGEFLGQVSDLLGQSETGLEALEDLKRNGVRVVVVDDGRGSRYSASHNRIYLDRRDGVARAALALVHEREHRSRVGQPGRPDVQRDSRDVYVNGMIREESDATVAAIRTREELIAAGHTEMRDVEYPGTEDYANGRSAGEGQYDAEHNERDEDPPNAEDREAAGRRGGEDQVRDGFSSGRYTTTDSESGQQQTYPDYYGGDYDSRHVSSGSGLGQ